MDDQATAPSVRQVSGYGPDGAPILSVLARRTHRIDGNGALEAHGEPTPLVAEAVADPAHPDLLAADTDLWPYKPQTDIIVLGHAYGDEPQFRATITIGTRRSSLQVWGERRACLTASGRIEFTPPAPLRDGRVALSPTMSYGGHDLASEAELGNPYHEFRGSFMPNVTAADLSPFRYPRNPWGRGYVVRGTPDAIGQALLPQIEDPDDLLTPARLVGERPARWPVMPVPASCSWLPYGTFLRLACLRVVAHGERPTAPLAEVARGWLPADVLDQGTPTAADAFRLTQGAWPSLRCDPLSGGETIILEHLHPRFPRLVLTLPTKRPELHIDGRQGKTTPTRPVLHTVLIEPDADRVTLVWRGSERALRPYLPSELAQMPFVVRW